jgi:glutaredoxin
MQFEKPTLIGYTIYTKTNCPYCIKVKDLLKNEKVENKIVNCDKYLEDPSIKEFFLEFIRTINGEIPHRTFPIVFYKGNFIGGFTDTEKFYLKENLFLNNEDF